MRGVRVDAEERMAGCRTGGTSVLSWEEEAETGWSERWEGTGRGWGRRGEGGRRPSGRAGTAGQ